MHVRIQASAMHFLSGRGPIVTSWAEHIISTGPVQYSVEETESEKTPGEGSKTKEEDYSHSPGLNKPRHTAFNGLSSI